MKQSQYHHINTVCLQSRNLVRFPDQVIQTILKKLVFYSFFLLDFAEGIIRRTKRQVCLLRPGTMHFKAASAFKGPDRQVSLYF